MLPGLRASGLRFIAATPSCWPCDEKRGRDGGLMYGPHVAFPKRSDARASGAGKVCACVCGGGGDGLPNLPHRHVSWTVGQSQSIRLHCASQLTLVNMSPHHFWTLWT